MMSDENRTREQLLDELATLRGRVAELETAEAEWARMEEALAEERNLLRTLIDNMPDFINIKDAESRFVVANTATAHQLGVATPGDVLGKTDFDFHAPELAEAYYAREQRIIRSGQPEINFEEFYVDQATGVERWSLFSKVPLQDRHGVITGIMNIGRDITERKQTEATLTEERNLLRTLIESLPSLVYVKDTESRFILANGRTEEFMGVPPKGLLGKTDFDFHPQEMAAEFYADEQAIIESGEPMLDKDEPNVDSAGDMRWYLVTKIPLRDSRGETVGLVGINRDITERKRAEEKLRRLNDELEQRVAERTAELRAEKEQTETILQNVADAIVLTDLNAEILYVNPAWEHLTGYSAAEAFNQNPRILQSGKTGSQVYIAMWGTVLAGETWRGILRNRRKDGTDYEAELTVAPVCDERGKIHYFVGIQRDVTEAQQLADMKEQFVADAAHDLSNPVAVLKTYLYLLKKAPEQLAERLPILEYQINRLANLIADLLNLSCLDRGMVEMNFVPLDLSAIVGLIVEAQRPLAHQKGQALIFEAEPNVPLILADAQQIGRVVVNLVANALNYTPEGGEVVARISQARGGVVLTVRDTGIGIGPDDLPLIFERFYRSDEAKASGQGTGLGLSIAEKIVEAHQGRIEVESVPGVGSAFRVILPVSENWKDGT